ncbi:hypothetical protein BX616_003437 [Lobosporangium transversale]|uniref:Uncharacterized protein n=1 Tax=Lobosporangium transversale TaxID=64571 RepID=A0A1Y2GCX0_9FUNG|nr:hypothetical protein BCR41DRAFT_388972 [Lobosporangium transversale]KAF9898933.1 hypothetical protein BX616_003437 [Lobosporangium transversale]ORZ07282.1 hypothetical protein BCR41DRAFT_388972 [Lobosporangium transversale]|eukprot:XP_021877945.1 hypothetical protein BCR41DRAFT_388972 [Lobosporangium transversale]
MNVEIESKAGRQAATKVGGMRVPAHDHTVPVVKKEHERKPNDKDADKKHPNEDERELEKLERFEYEKQTRLAAGERLARMQENQPKHQPNNNFKQTQNIQVHQPVLHNHTKSGAAVQQ